MLLYSLVGSSVVPTVNAPTIGVIRLTGDNTVQADRGSLLTKDAVVLGATGAGNFAEVDTVVVGTDRFAGASGQLTATGTFLADVGGQGVYSDEACTP